eukprot:TRINITY_DN6839_c0_g2_i1.p1 TRINITY_DN6839_c0_g2~~TRINITY_DN6839_c0_g2_i1.p1  ORF type:complete len:683 (+),score=143.69 TRINITY_DN6839_c0_g2_i1:158-2050(+)
MALGFGAASAAAAAAGVQRCSGSSRRSLKSVRQCRLVHTPSVTLGLRPFSSMPSFEDLGVPCKAKGSKKPEAWNKSGGSMSLEKELQVLGVTSRSKLPFLFHSGRITLDGVVVKDRKIDATPGSKIAIDGIEIDRDPPVLLKFHKPYDVICSMKDHKGRDDLQSTPGMLSPWSDEAEFEARIQKHKNKGVTATNDNSEVSDKGVPVNGILPWIAVDRYHPVGRLDRDTTGLLLFSRDGGLTSKLLSPARGVPRIYEAVVDGDAGQKDEEGRSLAEKLSAGVITEQGIFPGKLLGLESLSAEDAAAAGHDDFKEKQKKKNRGKAEPVKVGPRSRVRLEVAEGKYRMVRKMLYNCGLPVLELHRSHYGAVELGDLEVGKMERVDGDQAAWALQILEGKKRLAEMNQAAEMEEVGTMSNSTATLDSTTATTSTATAAVPAQHQQQQQQQNPTATFDTSMGSFQCELFLDRVPRTASNFIDLALSGFYNGIHFHRVIPGFMNQFGCPHAKAPHSPRVGSGGPPDGTFKNLKTGADEIRSNGGNIEDENISRDSNTFGTLSMANTGQPNSGNSQFFINVAKNDFLDWFGKGKSNHPVFGKVTKGMDVVVAISKVRTKNDNPVDPIMMKSITINGV